MVYEHGYGEITSRPNGKTKSFWVPNELSEKMDAMPEINWSEVARNSVEEMITVQEQIRRQRKMIRNSERDAQRIMRGY